MVKLNRKDTIAAISTPFGESGIGIVRLSGSNALRIGDKIFVGKNGLRLPQFPTYTLHHGFVVDKRYINLKGKCNKKIVDEVLVSVMRSPHTYTREDIVEINCHGGIIPLKKTLELVLDLGARLAVPGEFTQRAFCNGRIDLAQAEAVLNVVNAKTEAALGAAINQLQGMLSKQINELKTMLIEIMAPLEAAIDFPDEEIDTPSIKKSIKALQTLAQCIKDLIDTADRGIMIQNGISVVLAGCTNVGKSSLMNRFLDYDRVIVTPISGTTRDVVEEVINIDGLPVRIADTAGIIDSKCLIAKKSVDRSLAFLNKSDLVVLILDASRKINRFDVDLAKKLKNKNVLIVVNKSDLPQKIKLDSINKILSKAPSVKISALTGKGVNQLKKRIVKMFFKAEIPKNDELLISNIRHKQALQSCYQSIINAIGVATSGGFDECFIFELRQALCELDNIVGQNLDEDILDNIFSRFCIGK